MPIKKCESKAMKKGESIVMKNVYYIKDFSEPWAYHSLYNNVSVGVSMGNERRAISH